jgi:hypothetical protein
VIRRIGIDFLLLNLSECLEEVQRQRETYQREESARKFLSNEDPSIPMNLTNTLKKLMVDQHPTLYYIGGIDLLCQLIKDGMWNCREKKYIFFVCLETTRTAFRVNHGFDLFNSQSIFIEAKDENLSESIFQLMINLSEDDENAKQCLESQFFKSYLLKDSYSSIALKYLVEITLKNSSRLIFIQKITPNKYEITIFKLITSLKV